VLCPGLTVTFLQEESGEKDEWYYEDGLTDYLKTALADRECLPTEPFTGSIAGNTEEVTWALQWLPEDPEVVAESYVNLIPTTQGGTHVNGLRTGLLEALREFCEFRSLLPRGVKLTPDDIWERCSYVLSFKMQEPQFSGQTKERLSSREAASFISGVVKDAFSLWLNQHTDVAEALAEFVIGNAQRRLKSSRGRWPARRWRPGRRCPESWRTVPVRTRRAPSFSWWRATPPAVRPSRPGTGNTRRSCRCWGKILNTWEVDSGDILASQEVHDIAVAIGVDPGSGDLTGLRYNRVCILADADSDGMHIATLLCALFVKHFRPLVEAGACVHGHAPLYRIDLGKETFYALDEHEKQGILDRLAAENRKGKIQTQRFKGLGEMNPLQLRETTMAPDTRRLVQLSLSPDDGTDDRMDMLLGRSGRRIAAPGWKSMATRPRWWARARHARPVLSQSLIWRNTRLALVPPKPKLLLMTSGMSTSSLRSRTIG